MLGLVGFVAAAPAPAAEWTMDRAASRLEFVARYQGQDVPGVFRRFDVRLTFDPAALADSRLVVTVALVSADMDSGDINEAIAGPDWFHTLQFPQARFSSAAISRDAAGHYLASGTLELKGVVRRVSVPFTWHAAGASATMQGDLTLKRTDFGIGTGEWASTDAIGADVRVHFVVAFRRAG